MNGVLVVLVVLVVLFSLALLGGWVLAVLDTIEDRERSQRSNGPTAQRSNGEPRP